MQPEPPQSTAGESPAAAPVSRREIFSWAMFDFANSSYTTVVMTTIFNTYFVNVVASGQGGPKAGLATLLWTTAVAVSNLLVVLTAPVLGAFADHSAAKKQLLAASTAACAICTALLALTHAGTVPLAMALIIVANFAYGTGENLIAAFLTEISSREKMGRISALGLAIGYFGGPLVLSMCFVYIGWAQQHGQTQAQFVPACMLMVAVTYALAAAPHSSGCASGSSPSRCRRERGWSSWGSSG